MNVTGILEAAGGIALLIPRWRRLSGSMLALYAGCVFPANIKHAIDGTALLPFAESWWYHGPRLAMQPVIVWWALFCSGAIISRHEETPDEATRRMTEGAPLQERPPPHWLLRAFALLGAAFAAFMIAFMAWSLVQNWTSVDFRNPWLPLSMLACALALLWSGVSALRSLDLRGRPRRPAPGTGQNPDDDAWAN